MLNQDIKYQCLDIDNWYLNLGILIDSILKDKFISTFAVECIHVYVYTYTFYIASYILHILKTLIYSYLQIKIIKICPEFPS